MVGASTRSVPVGVVTGLSHPGPRGAGSIVSTLNCCRWNWRWNNHRSGACCGGRSRRYYWNRWRQNWRRRGHSHWCRQTSRWQWACCCRTRIYWSLGICRRVAVVIVVVHPPEKTSDKPQGPESKQPPLIAAPPAAKRNTGACLFISFFVCKALSIIFLHDCGRCR